jgi:hypothetical protein
MSGISVNENVFLNQDSSAVAEGKQSKNLRCKQFKHRLMSLKTISYIFKKKPLYVISRVLCVN